MSTIPYDPDDPGAGTAVSPVRVTGRLGEPLSRWLWLVKWLLVLPHLLVLALLWIAFPVLTLVALVAILLTGRYPRPIFGFTLGVLRWSWRVAYYGYGVLGTDRYPPFTLGPCPDYPATLDIAPPERLSRGLVLVKWWLLALPHYLVIGVFVGSGYVVYEAGTTAVGTAAGTQLQTASWGTGLVGLFVLFAAVGLLFTGRYPGGLFDLLLGLHRWILRVVAYSALMTDTYPPFRLDLGGAEPSTDSGPGPAGPAGTVGAGAAAAPEAPVTSPDPSAGWTAGRVITVVLGSVLVLGALASAAGGTALLVADRAGRDAQGFLSTPSRLVTGTGHALVFDPGELTDQVPDPGLGAALGDVRVRAAAVGGDVFVGVGPAAQVSAYLDGVARDSVSRSPTGDDVDLRPVPGGAPATAPGAQPLWLAVAEGPGEREVVWPATEGRWAVVVMNADASRPVVAEISSGATAPGLQGLASGLLIGGAVGLGLGALLLFFPLRRPAG